MTPRIPLPQHLASAAFTRRAGVEAGLGAKRLRGRDLQRPFRGVCVPGARELTVGERAEALRLTLPPVAFFCSLTAARLVIGGSHPLSSGQRLADVTARYPGRRGLRRLRRALELVDGRAESRKESVLRVVLEEGGLRGFVPNSWTVTSGGYHYRLDLALAARKVALEYQGDYRASIERFRADMTRISRLQADGWEVIQVSADDLRNPGELLRRIRRVIDAREYGQ